MTICAAGISNEGIIIVSDCRVTYDRAFSDSLQKTYPLTEYSAISFAGDIYCAQFIITRLNSKHLIAHADKGGFQLLKHTAKQIRRLYMRYSQQRPDCNVFFLLASCSGSHCWIGACSSPKFSLDITNTSASVRVIGDTYKARDAVTDSMVHALTSSFSGTNSALVAASFIDGALNLIYLDKYKDRDREHGVSRLFTLFRVSLNGVEFIDYNTEMFRGRIADRNKPLGHAKTNSVSYDPITGKFRLHDHQTGKSNVLSDIYSFGGQRRGIVNTNFDPYKLKA